MLRPPRQSGSQLANRLQAERLRMQYLASAIGAALDGLPDVVESQLAVHKLLGGYLNESSLRESAELMCLYRFLRNDPIDNIDPFGLACWTNPFTGTNHGYGTWKAKYIKSACATSCSQCLPGGYGSMLSRTFVSQLRGNLTAEDCEKENPGFHDVKPPFMGGPRA